MKLTQRWQWKWARLQNWVKDRQEEFSQLWKGAKIQHKMCPECRGLVDKKETTCPLCGTKLSGVPVGGVGRLVESYLPATGFYTATILALNILLYLAMTMVSIRQEGDGLANIFVGASGATLTNFGAVQGFLIEQGEFWRWVTAIFLHGGILHLGFNAMAMYSIGPQMEEIYGRSKFIFIYLLTGVGGYIASFVFLPSFVKTVGASGSLFGLIGVMAVYGHRRGGPLGHAIRRAMIQWAIYALVFGYFIGANNAAHIGGLVTGALLSFIVNDSPYEGELGGLWGVLELLSVLVILASFAMAFMNYGKWVR